MDEKDVINQMKNDLLKRIDNVNLKLCLLKEVGAYINELETKPKKKKILKKRK